MASLERRGVRELALAEVGLRVGHVWLGKFRCGSP